MEILAMRVIKSRITDYGEPICVKLTCLDENNSAVGRLTFDEPCSFNNEINIQEILIEPNKRRSGIGTILLNNLKQLSVTDYTSCPIGVFIAPIDNVDIDVLIEFYQSAGFEVQRSSETQDEAWGLFTP